MNFIPIKAWIATNGAFIAGVLATNGITNIHSTNPIYAVTPEVEEVIQYTTNATDTYLATSNFYVTNILSGEFFTNIPPVEHWYATPVPLWGVLLVVAALVIVVTVLMNAVKAERIKETDERI